MNQLRQYLEQIAPSNLEMAKSMERYLDGLTKPVGALGKLEEVVIKLAAIQQTHTIDISKKALIVMCADNGACEEGISECPQEVTAQVTYNFTRGITAINQLVAFTNAKLHVVDIGVKADFAHPQIHNRKIAYGTNNMAKEPAMTKEHAIKAIEVGIEETERLIEEGYSVFGTGEMGIGNTTTSAAIIALLTGHPISEIVDKGAGAKPQTLNNKINVIQTAIQQHQPNPNDPVDVLAKVGGLDIAGLVGVYLAAARHRKVVVIDGIISVAAALIAYSICKESKDYMLASHLSKEAGMRMALKQLDLEAHFDLGMRLGEGSGCPLMFQVMDIAHFTLMNMGTFEDAGVDKSAYMNIWKEA